MYIVVLNYLCIMIKKRKNIDIESQALKIITIAAIDKGVTPKKLIEQVVEQYAEKARKELLKDA